jgi:hypothetical protein
LPAMIISYLSNDALWFFCFHLFWANQANMILIFPSSIYFFFLIRENAIIWYDLEL